MENEHPILFSGPMVRAILEGHKSQTRRVIKPQPVVPPECTDGGMKEAWLAGFIDVKCPYGVPGDRLWVREAFFVQPDLWAESHERQSLHYEADIADRRQVEGYRLRPSMFMPRWASRITLEITRVRVELAQNISEDDVMAEGGEDLRADDGPPRWRIGGYESTCPIEAYAMLWDSLSAKRGYSWETNPWVWVIEFRKL